MIANKIIEILKRNKILIISFLYGVFVYCVFMIRHGTHSLLSPEIYYYSLVVEGMKESSFNWTQYMLRLLSFLPHSKIPFVFPWITISLMSFWVVAIYRITRDYFDDMAATFALIFTFVTPMFITWRMGFFTNDVIQITFLLIFWFTHIKLGNKRKKIQTLIYLSISLVNFYISPTLLMGTLLLIAIMWEKELYKFINRRPYWIAGAIVLSVIAIFIGKNYYFGVSIDSTPLYKYPVDALYQFGILWGLFPIGIYYLYKEKKVSFIFGALFLSILTFLFMQRISRFMIIFWIIIGSYAIGKLENKGKIAIWIGLIWIIFTVPIYFNGEYVAQNGVHHVEHQAIERMSELKEGTIYCMWDKQYTIRYLTNFPVKRHRGDIFWKNQEVAYDLARKNEIKYIYLTNYEFRIIGNAVPLKQCGDVKIYPIQTRFTEPKAPCLTLSELYFPSRFIYAAMYDHGLLYGFYSVNWIWQEDIYGYGTELQIWIIEVL